MIWFQYVERAPLIKVLLLSWCRTSRHDILVHSHLPGTCCVVQGEMLTENRLKSEPALVVSGSQVCFPRRRQCFANRNMFTLLRGRAVAVSDDLVMTPQTRKTWKICVTNTEEMPLKCCFSQLFAIQSSIRGKHNGRASDSAKCETILPAIV